jgi:TonB family protein
VRRSVAVLALLMLAGCGSPPPDRADAKNVLGGQQILRRLRISPPPGQAGAKDVAHPRIHAGDKLNCNKLLRNVRPVYAKEAKQKHIEGTVTLRARITKAGDVRDIMALKGNPDLVPEAVRAAKQWRHAACFIDSEPIEVMSILAIDFKLSQ